MGMEFKISHTTTYAYSEPVPVCRNQVLLTPRDTPTVRCRTHRLTITPTPSSTVRRKDYFGNHVHYFSVEANHRQLRIAATGRVLVEESTPPPPEETVPWDALVADVRQARDADWLSACEFVFDSSYITASDEFAEYARPSFPPRRPILAGALDLTRRIHQDFKYDTKTTSVSTRPDDAFRLRSGVCQDFAHVEINCLRSLGIPARYVSGYLRTLPPPGQPRLVGADQSHAWLSVYTGPTGWIDLDPTNNTLCGTDHIPVAWGRDYGDVAPIKGVFLGGGTHQLSVSVDVAPVERKPAESAGPNGHESA